MREKMLEFSVVLSAPSPYPHTISVHWNFSDESVGDEARG